MNNNTLIMLGLIAIMAICSIGMSLKKRLLFRRLQGLLTAGDFDAFFELIDKPLTRILYPEYNLSYFKLNAYLLKDDTKAATEMLEDLLNRKLGKKQRRDLVVKAFNIYLGQENRKRTQALLEEIESWDDETMRGIQHECRRTYDIVILGKSNYIDEMEREVPETQGMMRGRLEYFLALQYENRGEKDKRDEWMERASKDSFQMPNKA